MQTASKTSERAAAPTASRKRLWLPLFVLAAVVLLLFGVLAGLRLARAGALPGTVVAEVRVGGMRDDTLRRAISSLATNRAARRITAERDDASVTASAAELGYQLDVDATVDAVLRRGRQWNPFSALADHIRAFGGTIAIAPVESLDETTVAAWAEEAADRLSSEPVEGDVRFDGLDVVRQDPVRGADVAADALRAQAMAALTGAGEPTFAVETSPVEPVTTVAQVDALVAQAQRAIADEVRLEREGGAIAFSPDEIASILRTSSEGGQLRFVGDPDVLASVVTEDEIAAVETDAVDARFELSGGTVRIIASVDGFTFDAGAAAEQLAEVATGTGSRSAELAGEVTQPELSTEDAEALGITERVSTFTTNHSCCQSRVTNIHRIADLMNGVVIRPGDVFSVNEHVGPRTAAKGFVEGGAIQAGEFVQEVGGGVSQFATTMFNAAFFGGYKLREYKAHSYYISRYPVGREATLNYPNVDLAIENNSPHGILIATSYSDTSITVSFYGTKWVEVSDITGERHNYREPETRVRENPALAPGSERTVQSGRQGFDVTVTRILTFPDGREERQEFFTRYLAEPRIVERNSATPEPPQPEPTGEPTAPPSQEPPPPPPSPDPPPSPPPEEPPPSG